jgi:hypothetical protein
VDTLRARIRVGTIRHGLNLHRTFTGRAQASLVHSSDNDRIQAGFFGVWILEALTVGWLGADILLEKELSLVVRFLKILVVVEDRHVAPVPHALPFVAEDIHGHVQRSTTVIPRIVVKSTVKHLLRGEGPLDRGIFHSRKGAIYGWGCIIDLDWKLSSTRVHTLIHGGNADLRTTAVGISFEYCLINFLGG